jgi:hypothetical protein
MKVLPISARLRALFRQERKKVSEPHSDFHMNDLEME